MKLPRVSAKTAAQIDNELMGPIKFSIDQLMELAGLAVAECVSQIHNPKNGPNVLILAGPGNNGGDGLVASRHLKLRGFKPKVYYPKPSKGELFSNLQTQLQSYGIPFITNINYEFKQTDFIVDSLFGFSFKPPVREAFSEVMRLLETTEKEVLAVDVPSSWDVNNGPMNGYMPTYLISLTAPKTCSNFFKGRHFIGGRFITDEFAAKYGFKVPEYEGLVWEEI